MPVAELMVSAKCVVDVNAPDVPVTVIVEVPAAAVLLAVRVRTLVAVVGLMANVAVTPVGNPDTASVTLPLNPPTSVTEMVSVALPPGAKVTVALDDARVKPGVDDPPIED